MDLVSPPTKSGPWLKWKNHNKTGDRFEHRNRRLSACGFSNGNRESTPGRDGAGRRVGVRTHHQPSGWSP